MQRYYYDSHTWFQYTYNRNGIRTGKNFYDTVKFDYVVDGDKVIAQTWLDNTMLFYYDQNGAPQSVRYNGTLYNYVLNLQGDVVQIRDTDGNLVVQYLYNAWGKVLKVVDADGNTVTSGVGYENPLRYRGYYYDWESGFYYLNSRYYDPEIGRFISPDSYVSTGQGLIGYNMYAYCGNNPVARVDPSGRIWSLVILVALVGGCVFLTGDEDQTPNYEAEAHSRYNESNVSVYERGDDSAPRKEVNVEFYHPGGDENRTNISIDKSLEITSSYEQDAILDVIIANPLYSEEKFGTKEFMRAQWQAHNMCYSVATSSRFGFWLSQRISRNADPIESSKSLDLRSTNNITRRHWYIYKIFEALG